MKDRVRRYLPVVGAPSLVIVLAVIVVCLATILLTGGRLAALPSAIAETWFALHGVPVTFDGVTLGAMPLLPPIGVAAFVAWRVRQATKDRVSILDLYVITGLAILIPFTLSAIAWLMVADAGSVFPVQPPAVHKGLFIPVFIHLVGIAWGMSERLWRALFRRLEAPTMLIDATLAALRSLGALLAASGVVFLILLALGYQRIGELMEQFTILSGGGAVALFGACVLYLPNAAVSTLTVLLGAPFKIAQGNVSLFDATLVPLPPLPLFGAIPAAVPAWAPVLMAVPAAVLIFRAIRRRLNGLEILVAGLCAAVAAVVATLMSGGEAGAYGWIGPHPWFFALAVFAWFVVITGVAWLVGLVKRSRGGKSADAEEIDIAETAEVAEIEEAEEVEAAENVEETEAEESTTEEAVTTEDAGGETVVGDESSSSGSTAISVLKAQDGTGEEESAEKD